MNTEKRFQLQDYPRLKLLTSESRVIAVILRLKKGFSFRMVQDFSKLSLNQKCCDVPCEMSSAKERFMRIQPEEKAAIISTITRIDNDSEIYLFGSRLDDTKRGGDIDILVKSDTISRSMLAHIEDEIFSKIDEQKIDFVLTRKNELNAFSRKVLARGAVQLW